MVYLHQFDYVFAIGLIFAFLDAFMIGTTALTSSVEDPSNVSLQVPTMWLTLGLHRFPRDPSLSQWLWF
jgi:hypothetical protein